VCWIPARGYRRFLGLTTNDFLEKKATALSNQAHSVAKAEEEDFIETAGGGRVWYRANGLERRRDGRLPLLIIHGGPAFSHHYLLSLADLAQHRPVYFYDQLDTGNSDRPGNRENWTLDYFVSEVDTVRAALGLDRVHILGQSWGGTVAAAYGAAQPAGLAGLVLASPCIDVPQWFGDNVNWRRGLPENIRGPLDRHEAAGTTESEEYVEAVGKFANYHFCRLDPWPEDILKSLEVMNVEQFETMWGPADIRCTGTLRSHDGSDELHKIAAPTLYICGEYDEASPGTCRRYADATPTARLTVLPDASHVAHYEQREMFMEAVEGFLKDVEAA
jgi:proline-specific peptidase